MAKNTDSSIKLLVLYDILLKTTDETHALSTNEIIEELQKRGISVSRKVLPSDIDLLNKYGYEICSYVKKSRYYYAVHQLFDTAEITMLTDVIKASKLTETRKETIINKLCSTICCCDLYRSIKRFAPLFSSLCALRLTLKVTKNSNSLRSLKRSLPETTEGFFLYCMLYKYTLNCINLQNKKKRRIFRLFFVSREKDKVEIGGF